MAFGGQNLGFGNRAVVWTVLVVTMAVITAIGSPLFRGDSTEFSSTAYALETASAGPVFDEQLECVETIRLRPGQHMADAFLEAGASADVGAVLAHLEDTIDIRRVRPSDTFLLYLSRSGEVRRLDYERKGVLERVVVEKESGEFLTRVEHKSVETFLKKVEGRVDDNLFFAMSRAGGDANLVMNFADLFAWDFDFYTETRAGDQFELLVEETTVDGIPGGFGRILAARYLPEQADEPLEVYSYTWNEGKDSGYYTGSGKSIRKFFLKSPLNFRRISSRYTHRRLHPILKQYRPHLGIDYAAPAGTPVVALGNGRVMSATWRKGFGRTVQIRHNKTTVTQYAHLKGYARGIKGGVRVKQGQVIGYVGSSGLATAAHLDFRVKRNGKWINPLRLKGGQSEPLPENLRDGFALEVKQLNRLMKLLPRGHALRLTGLDAPVGALALARLDTPSPS